MANTFNTGNAAALMAGAIHNAGIELNDSRGVGVATQAYGLVGSLGFGEVDALLDGIEIGATAHQNLERLVVGRLAERPGRDNERSLRRIRRLIRRQGFWQSSVADHNQRSPAHELSS